jgi:phosphatidylinositol alpha-1,6-mannosyltransferase
VQFSLQALRETLVWRPDVIHGAHVNFTPLLYWLAKLSKAMTVVNIYGLELWSGLSNARRKYLYRMDQVISDFHAIADHLASDGMHPDHPTVTWDCADLGRFHPSPFFPHLLERYDLPDPAHHHVLMTLGRLAVSARHKGYDRLLDVFFQVRERVPTAHLVFAGRGDDAERLEAKAMSLGLSEWVTFTGSIDEEDLPDLYRAAHVFALVSDKGPDRGEGIPLTPIEARHADCRSWLAMRMAHARR